MLVSCSEVWPIRGPGIIHFRGTPGQVQLDQGEDNLSGEGAQQFDGLLSRSSLQHSNPLRLQPKGEHGS